MEVVHASDTYLELVRQCPLRLLHTEVEYRRAVAMLDRLSDLGPARSEDQTEYLLALAFFVEKYERAHVQVPTASGAAMLGYLIETHGVTQGEVAAGAGLVDSTISEILAGKRKLSVRHIGALARFFKVEPAVFLDA